MNWSSKWSTFIESISNENFQQLIKTGLINTLLIAVFIPAENPSVKILSFISITSSSIKSGKSAFNPKLTPPFITCPKLVSKKLF